MRSTTVHNVKQADAMNAAELRESRCVIRGTNASRGRVEWVNPETAAVKHLRYGRIVLDATDQPIRFSTAGRELGLICLEGTATVHALAKQFERDQQFELGQYDALYVPKDTEVSVKARGTRCDVAEISAPVDNSFPTQLVRYSDVRNDPGLHFKTGGAGCTRELNILLGKNIQAGRIVAGVTFSDPGNWTSWPPHEHAELLEEAYLYIDMPSPAWGLQFVYTNPEQPEMAVVVREGDCVVMPRGYHPNVAAPGGSINFLWMMAAHREVEDRLFGVVNVQPEYASGSSGLEKGRAGE